MATPIISQDEMSAYLGRALSTTETTNYQLYLGLAQTRLEDLLCDELILPLAADLALVLARCFAVIAQEQESSANLGVASKKVEDFSISYKSDDDETPMVSFVTQNQATIDKYSRCTGPIRSGRVPSWRRKHGYCV